MFICSSYIKNLKQKYDTIIIITRWGQNLTFKENFEGRFPNLIGFLTIVDFLCFSNTKMHKCNYLTGFSSRRILKWHYLNVYKITRQIDVYKINSLVTLN